MITWVGFLCVILFLIFVLINENNLSLFIIFGVIFSIIIISLILSFFFWKTNPHYYKIKANGLYLEFARHKKFIKWNDIEKIDKKFKVNIFGDTTIMLITKNNEKYNIGAFFYKDVVDMIIKKYNKHKQKK